MKKFLINLLIGAVLCTIFFILADLLADRKINDMSSVDTVYVDRIIEVEGKIDTIWVETIPQYVAKIDTSFIYDNTDVKIDVEYNLSTNKFKLTYEAISKSYIINQVKNTGLEKFVLFGGGYTYKSGYNLSLGFGISYKKVILSAQANSMGNIGLNVGIKF